MTQCEELEKSMINYVKKLSVDELRNNPSFTFSQICIPVQTKYNNGIIKKNNNSKGNCCFFISICDGLHFFNINVLHLNYKGKKVKMIVDPVNLIGICEYPDIGQIFDTDNETHIKCLYKLINLIPDISIEFFIGFKNNDGLMTTTPDTSFPPIGNGKKIIRILNIGSHFEFITTENNKFIYKPRTMNSDTIFQLQQY